MNAPPFLSRKLPLLGHALEFRKDRFALIERGIREIGPAFSIRLGPQPAVVLSGAENQTLFFKETDKSLNMGKPYDFLREGIGNVAFVADHETYVNQRPTLYAPFTREKLTRYISIMQEVVQGWLDSLPESGRMNIVEESTNLVAQVAGYCFGGKEFMEEVGAEFWEKFEDIGKAMDPMLPAHWPLPKFKRRDRARKRLGEILTPILRKRRANPEKYDDVLQDIIMTPFKDGNLPGDEELLSLTLGIMFAGHETTAGQAAWTVIQVLQHPDYHAILEEEITEKFPYGSHFDAKSLVSLKKVRWAVDETTRMRPSADVLMRIADEPLQVGAYTIPKDWMVFIASENTGNMQEIFTNPKAYDPFRFSKDRSEHKPHKNCIAGFGGGIHKCAGMNFALNEMIIITTLLIQQFDLELETQNPAIDRDLGSSRPTPTWIRFKRKPVTEMVKPQVIEEAIAAGCPHMRKAMQTEMANVAPVQR